MLYNTTASIMKSRNGFGLFYYIYKFSVFNEYVTNSISELGIYTAVSSKSAQTGERD